MQVSNVKRRDLFCREAAQFNESLDSTGFCACVLPLDFSWLTVFPPVSQLRRST
jgi:hypothetical protein